MAGIQRSPIRSGIAAALATRLSQPCRICNTSGSPQTIYSFKNSLLFYGTVTAYLSFISESLEKMIAPLI
jgi:hypothetical protein